MNEPTLPAGTRDATQDIVVEDVFPHALETIWKVLTTGDLMARWMMPPTGFQPVPGTHFTFQTRPAGEWDGTIRCEVLEVIPHQRLVYAWQGGHESNVGYGSRLDTVVTWTLTPVEGGTRLRVVHAGFVIPKNETAYQNMSEGWKTVMQRLGALSDTLH